MRQENNRVVITGMGTYNPLANDVETTWQRIMKGESGIDTITQFDASDYKTTFAGEVKDFDPNALFGRKEVRRLSRVAQFALAATQQALDDAKFNSTVDKDRVGVVLGSGMGSLDPVIENVNVFNERGPYRVSPFFVPMMLSDTPAAMISIAHGFRGPNMSVQTACATGNNVVGEAAKIVQRGDANVMIAGGSEASILPLIIAGFSVMQAMSTRNDAPKEALRPFDKDRDGFVVSEGSAVLVLESLEHAKARGAHIYGEVLGYGTSADAYHISMPAENGEGAIMSMKNAIKSAEISPKDVQYINAHGTSTELNDKGETAGIKAVFGEHAYDLAVSSSKSMHGHLLGAAGVLEAIVCLKSLENGISPPTLNYTTPDPLCDLDYVPNYPRAKPDLKVVMSNGFGLGGHNATLIFGKYSD